jgi:hypothetical protein
MLTNFEQKDRLNILKLFDFPLQIKIHFMVKCNILHKIEIINSENVEEIIVQKTLFIDHWKA